MFILYSVLLTVAFIILSPRFLFDALRRGKYAAGFRQRMGRLPKFDVEGKPVIWLHCVSVGETQAARPLVDELRKTFPGHKLVISTVTNTGQQVAQDVFGDKATLIFYFPFDWKFTVRRALKAIDPQLILIVETELWFNFLREAHARGAKVAIVNGRLSERSANRYMWIRGFVARGLRSVDLALMQHQDDALRIKELGMKNSRIHVTGNIKYDQTDDITDNSLTEEFRKRFAISPEAPLILAASTHEPEEQMVLDAFAKIKKDGKNPVARLMIAPRHPERFDAVAKLVAKAGFVFVRRSAEAGIADKAADVILLDSIGELRAVYALAELVFVGGSLVSHGGQNILEPATAKKAIVTGPHTMNFAAAIAAFREKDALVQLPEMGQDQYPEKLAEIFTELLKDDAKREQLGENALAAVRSNHGAAGATVKSLKSLLEKQLR
jgi:3-deoxy-D-manno-octulosonic-acid transferase